MRQRRARLPAFRLETDHRARVWGGRRLRSCAEPIGEAWVVYEQNRVLDGPFAGRSLAELAARAGADLLGEPVVAHTGLRFPVLIKLLDTTDWLSVQVHPNNQDARRLEGEDTWGKAEAWHILDAEPEARVVTGLRPGTDQTQLADAVRGSGFEELLTYATVAPGDTIDVPPGQLHALGPGLLLYELQQTSDITYRVYDWQRPSQNGRALHVEQSLAVVDPTLTATPMPAPVAPDGVQVQLLENELFRLSALRVQRPPIEIATERRSFHALTAIDGPLLASGEDWGFSLSAWDTLVVPASTGAYTLRALHDSAHVLIARAV